ncbi:MAG: 6-pyruvoyl trahydropterin synthase family protein [Thermoguttaceae bacterium]
MPDYSVRIAGDNLIYSAAHFIILPGGVCEPLHGHNYRTAVELHGSLDEFDCVIDFLALLQIMKSILAELDHAVLLPTRHPAIQISAGEDEVEVRFGPRRWVFPRAECRLLPISSTTVERMANYLARRLLETLASQGFVRPTRVRIELEESPGCWASCEIPPE